MRHTREQGESGSPFTEAARYGGAFALGILAGAGLVEAGQELRHRWEMRAHERARANARAEAVTFTPEWLADKVDLSVYERTKWLDEVAVGWHAVQPPYDEFEEQLLAIATPGDKGGALWHKRRQDGELAIAFRAGNVGDWQIGVLPDAALKRAPDAMASFGERASIDAAVIRQAGGPGFVALGVRVEGQFMPFPTIALEAFPERWWLQGDRPHIAPAGLPLIERPPVEVK